MLAMAARIDDETADLTRTITRRPKGTFLRVFAGGALTTYVLPSSGAIVVGRGPDADVRIDTPAASRRHARIAVGPPIVLEDLNSHNGTEVRGVRLAPGGRVILSPGDDV